MNRNLDDIQSGEQEWTEGVCDGGAVILHVGQPVAIAEVLARLNRTGVLGHDEFCGINSNRPCDCYCTDDAAGPRLEDYKEVIAAALKLFRKLHYFFIDTDEAHAEISEMIMRLIDMGHLKLTDPWVRFGDRTDESASEDSA